MKSDSTQGEETAAEKDARIRENIQIMSNSKDWSQQEIRDFLSSEEGVNPDDYMGAKAGLGRALGLGGRAVVQGAGALAALPGNLVDMAGMGFQMSPMGGGSLTPHPVLPRGLSQAPVQAAAGAANAMGLPSPETPGERVAVAGGEAAVGSLPFLGMGAPGLMSKLGQVGVAGLSGMAGQQAQEMGYGPTGQMVASLGAGLGPPLVLGVIGPELIRNVFAGTAARREAARQSAAILQMGDPSAPMTLGQIVDPGGPGRWGIGRGMEQTLRKTPTGTQEFKNTLDEQAQLMKSRTEGLADRLAPGAPTVEQAGRVVVRGLKEGFIPRMDARAEQLYDRVWQLIPKDTKVQPATLVHELKAQGDLAAQVPELAETLVNPTIMKWGNAFAAALEANPDGLPLEVMKAFRGKLGKMLTGADEVENVDLGVVKQLYGAVSNDIRTTIQQVNPQALKTWDQTQTWYRSFIDRTQKVVQPLIDKRTPEAAYNMLKSESADGATTLRRTMHSLLPEERRIVSSSVLRRMGLASPDKQNDLGDLFDPNRFLTNWNRYSREAKDALFHGGANPGLGKEIDVLAKAMDLQKSVARRLYNPAGTATGTSFTGIVQGLVTGASVGLATKSVPVGVGIASSAMIAASANNLMARAFTNPKIIHWLVRQTKVPTGYLAQELAGLAKDSRKWDDPEAQSIAEGLVSSLGNVDWNQLRWATVMADGAGDDAREKAKHEELKALTQHLIDTREP